MSEVGAIAKGRKNQQQGYSFRGIDDAYQAFQPVFAKHGVFVVPNVLKSTREERQTKSGGALIYTTLEVKHTFYCAEDGTSFDAVTIGEAMDSGDKSSNKAMSAAMKYALLEVFCVPTEADNDTENHSHEPAPKVATSPIPAPARPILKRIDDADVPAKKVKPVPHSERLAKMMTKFSELGVLPKEVQAFAVEGGYIMPNETAEKDWPESKMPATKQAFDDLCEELIEHAQKTDNIP